MANVDQDMKHTVFLLVLMSISTIAHPDSLIDPDHPAIRATAQSIVEDLKSDREKAIALHDYVRDTIPFGFTRHFYNQRASAVLESRIGYCNTKSTLLKALLHSVGLKARQRFVDIHKDILRGFIDPGTPYVDHSFLEVYIEGRWVRTDSYIVDKALATRSKQRLIEEGRTIGYGVHVNGTSEWDGVNDAFSQFHNDGSFSALTQTDHGVFDDVAQYYRSVDGHNELNGLSKLFFGIFARQANKNIEALRNGI